jgi:2,3-diaminopropionate biosynthesis protein SbnA
MIVSSPLELINGDCFFQLSGLAPHFNVAVKLEGYSNTGSIKVKAAIHMLETLRSAGMLEPGTKLIESSSGNLGLALSMACAVHSIPFICVSDPNISSTTARLIKAYGAELVIVTERDENGGYLGSRLSLIARRLDREPELVWVNQYSNVSNVEAHRLTTAQELLARYPTPDYVFIGAGTTGTLGGVSAVIRERSPGTIIVATDSIGSVTFGGAAGPRFIPGLGSSVPPPIVVHSNFDRLVYVAEIDAVKMCRALARKGLLLGGSSGTVLAGVTQLANEIEPNACVVAISPDLGDRYADSIYNDDWVTLRFPDALLTKN